MWGAYERLSWLTLGTSAPRCAPRTFASAYFRQPDQARSTPTHDNGRNFQPAVRSPAVARPKAWREVPDPPRKAGARDRTQRQGQYRPGEGVAVTPKASRQPQGPRSSPTSAPRREDGATLAGLLESLGAAVHALHSFDTITTLQELRTIPSHHYETGFVLDMVARCHFEATDYKKAEEAYGVCRRLEKESTRTTGLEYYSVCLWHLRKEVELGYLTHEVLQWDRLRPQTWCVVGNCFSLQKEHDTAIKFFKRAIQLDPSFTYAYTLCAHEYVANEKFDRAIAMYEHAISTDCRHYNAWFGLGNIYHRQEEYENAKYHFRKALEINPGNSVLRSYLGMVYQSLGHLDTALKEYAFALRADAQNGMALFQKACVLISLERWEEALEDLTKARKVAPKEACVYFQLGRVYWKLDRPKKAVLHYNIALDLNRDTKDHHTIRNHIEKVRITDLAEDTREDGLTIRPGAGNQPQGPQFSSFMV